MPHSRQTSKASANGDPHKLTLQSSTQLPNSKVTIPRLGFGVYLSSGATCLSSCLTAFHTGYRHIDTAQYYANEQQVGRAILEAGIPRSELFITSKILAPATSPQNPGVPDEHETYLSIIGSTKHIAAGEKGYIDLFLIHSPSSGPQGRKTLWKGLERAYREGRVRAIGVSNFGAGHIEELKEYAEVWPPHVNQIELHPWCQQRQAVEYCQKHGIVIEAYCPLVRNEKAKDETLLRLSKKHNKTAGQVLIRWSLQKGWVPLPKSDTPSRIEGNADVFDFNLDNDDMAALDSLDMGDKGAIVEVVKN
ncbi:putative aldo-keto reductase [Viridothelium virens]|uniref:Putative aldo-keto reductase n=1 Tax=Viridothelium virens TaxID=1048519 RepID=A0A6A6HMV9_VIRVR|nr:putative aldo-keto reductase [Viridothelium virens]